ncbi:MAG: hypothetical protein RLY86_2489 [Pseudomonadota bacterium]|jgi:predicted deacylase
MIGDIMTHSIRDIAIPLGRPGTARSIRVHRFGGEGAGPRVYIQAGLHAGEIPGLLVANHLITRLARLDAEGRVTGDVVVVPVANPIGLDQMIQGTLFGRFELATGVNFNRAYADLSDIVAEQVRGRLGLDPAANVALIRAELRSAIASRTPATHSEALRRTLMGLAMNADVVLDMHCDAEAVLHLYTMPVLWEGFADLSARLGCRAAFLEEESGGDPFDETCSGFWRLLRRKLGGDNAPPIPMACAATTLELRGEADVDDATAGADADAIIAHLQVRGAVAGDPPPAPAPRCTGTPLAGVERLTAPVAGVVVYHAALGSLVAPGDRIADILDPLTGERTPVTAGIAGPVWARSLQRYLSAGDTVARIAGPAPLPRRGSLLSA